MMEKRQGLTFKMSKITEIPFSNFQILKFSNSPARMEAAARSGKRLVFTGGRGDQRKPTDDGYKPVFAVRTTADSRNSCKNKTKKPLSRESSFDLICKPDYFFFRKSSASSGAMMLSTKV